MILGLPLRRQENWNRKVRERTAAVEMKFVCSVKFVNFVKQVNRVRSPAEVLILRKEPKVLHKHNNLAVAVDFSRIREPPPMQAFTVANLHLP